MTAFLVSVYGMYSPRFSISTIVYLNDDIFRKHKKNNAII